ncbi:hypothetical protein [Streptomyces mayteni]
MVGFHDLYNVRLDELATAVDDWERQERDLVAMAESAATMGRRATTANWAGENRGVTVPHVVAIADEFDAALAQATSLRRVLHDAHARLRRCRDDLWTVVDTDAPAAGVTVSPDGRVTTDLTGLDGDTRRERQDAVLRIADEIQRVLRRAAEHDRTIARALRDIAGPDEDRFNPVSYASLDAADLAYRDARAFLDLAANPAELTDGDVVVLATLLEAHADDPVFAERIATGLGARGGLEFWRDLTNSREVLRDTAEWTHLADLQSNLGVTLGLATRSDSTAMREWERDMIDLGDDRVGGVAGPYGFQVMSALMNSGEYDRDYLVAYGDRLLTFERNDGRTALQLWDSDPELVLNFAPAEDTAEPPEDLSETEREQWERQRAESLGNLGRDPMTGFLTALGNTPEAATAFFAPPADFDPTSQVDLLDADSVEAHKETLNERLLYLTTERDWWNSVDDYGPPEPLPAHSSLGEALLAAAAGHPAREVTEESLTEDFRTPATRQVMEQVVHLYGSVDPTLLARQPQMAESLGSMAASYMSDINYTLSADTNFQRETHAETYAPPYDNVLGNDYHSTIRFLTVLGHDQTAHQVVTQAQQIYTLGTLDAQPPVNEENYREGIDAIRTSATVRGILDHARVDQVNAEFGAESAAAQQSLGQTTSWLKSATGTVVSAGVGAGVAVSATTLSGGMAVVVPIAAGGAGTLLTEFLNQNIDQAMQSDVNVPRQTAVTEQNFFRAGETEIAGLKEQYAMLASDHLGRTTIDNELTLLDTTYLWGGDLAASHGTETTESVN